MTVEDPFGAPAPILSEFPNAASFRGRLVLIKPNRYELDAPKQGGGTADRVTATVTVVDGEGDVQLCPQQIPSGTFVPGPVYTGIWFQQKRVVEGLCPSRKLNEGLTLARIQTYKPGKPAAEGNPWGLIDPTEEDKETARAFLKAQQSATVDAALGKTEPVNPFG